MKERFKAIYDKLEQYKGKKLATVLAITFAVFIAVGFGIGSLVSIPYLNKNNNLNTTTRNTVEPPKAIYYEGTVTYVNPDLYPEENISYSLVDRSGKEVILLRSMDQKLVVSEGQYVKAYGSMSKTADGKKDVLVVDKVVITNAPN